MRNFTDIVTRYAGRMTVPEDIMFCPECCEMCDMYMVDEEYQWAGPVSVCRNDRCGYFVRSLERTRKEMGVSWMYRNCYSHADHDWFPIAFTITDNPMAFFSMGAPWDAIFNWNACLDWSETQKGNDPDMWEAMYPGLKEIK